VSPRLWLAALGAALAGCAGLPPSPFETHLTSQSAELRECAAWYRDLDNAVEAAGVRDVQYTRMQGFPYMRVDRLLASLAGRAAANEVAMRAWSDHLL